MKKIIILLTMTMAMIFSSCGDRTKIDKLIISHNDTSVADKQSSTIVTTKPVTTVSEPSESSLETTSKASEDKADEYDVDLTVLDSTMVYAQVYDMVYNAENYVGKKVKARGNFAYYQEPDGREFFAVIISDATACCSQGLEFVLAGNYVYPDDYPPLDTEITITGVFDYYEERNVRYCRLLNADYSIDETDDMT